LLLILCFATNPTTKALYSKCETCRPKHAKKSHAKRDAEVAEKKATIEAMLESGELVRCQDCGPKPLESFATNPTTGKPLTRCKPCNEKKNEQGAEYKKTEAGKATEKRYTESELGKASHKRAKASDKGKASNKLYKTSELGKATKKRAKRSDKGKAAIKRWEESVLGKAARKRAIESRQARIRESTAMQNNMNMLCLANNLISGRSMTSPTFLERSSFTSEVQFFEVLEATFAPGMTLANHGPVWEVEHKIPREAYDFDDPEDVKRCWSVKNVHTMTPTANKEKHWKLIDEYITAAGVENFPKAWNGQFPDAQFKAAHAAKMLAQKAIDDEEAFDDDEEALDDDEEALDDDEEAASEQPSGSNDVGPAESYGSDSD